MKVRKKTKIWNRYSQVPDLTKKLYGRSDKNTRKNHIPESKEVSPFLAGDDKAARNRQIIKTKINLKHK